MHAWVHPSWGCAVGVAEAVPVPALDLGAKRTYCGLTLSDVYSVGRPSVREHWFLGPCVLKGWEQGSSRG